MEMLTPGQEGKDERGMETSAPPCGDGALLEQNKKGNNINEKTHLLNSYYVLGAIGGQSH